MTEVDIPTIINSALVIAGAVGVPVLVVAVAKFKGKLSAFREFIVELDEDVKDNHLSEEEYKRLVAKFKALVA